MIAIEFVGKMLLINIFSFQRKRRPLKLGSLPLRRLHSALELLSTSAKNVRGRRKFTTLDLHEEIVTLYSIAELN